MLAASLGIADQIERYDIKHDYSLPHIPDAEGQLLEVIKVNFKRLVLKDHDVYKARLRSELKLLRERGLFDYFYMTWDLVNYALSNNMLPSPGRGSAAGSLVCYLLGITHADPIAHGLLFDRFLNEFRAEPPDIDLDFPKHRRQEVIDYFETKYNAAPMATLSEFDVQGVMRDLCSVQGIQMPFPKFLGKHKTLDAALTNVPEYQDMVAKYPKLAVQAKGMLKRTRHLGKHASGFALRNELLPVVRTARAPRAASFSDGVNSRELSDMGFIKFDLLGLAGLSILQKCLEDTNRPFSFLNNVDLEDRKVLEKFMAADVLGIFQFETANGRNLTKMIRPTQFTDLAVITALNRPGVLDAKMEKIYADRKSGKTPWTASHPVIQEVLGETYGVIVFQEQIMALVNRMAGLSLSEADNVRKDIVKLGKSKETGHKAKIASHSTAFVAGCIQAGLPKKEAEKLWSDIAGFARYGFNKAHAVCYSLVAYWMMWFKVYNPEVFYAACITYKEEERQTAFINEAVNRGITVSRPDVNLSKIDAMPGDKEIFLGLNKIKGLGIQGYEAIVAAQPFTSLGDFRARVPKRKVNSRAFETLESAKAFRSLSA